jgi:hypothetical protein
LWQGMSVASIISKMGCALVVITGNKGICGHQMPTPCPSANLFVQERAKLFHFIAAKSRK